MQVLRKLSLFLGWFVALLLSWALVYWLVIIRNVGQESSFWAPERLFAYLIFLLAPAVTFLPLTRRAGVPFLELEALIGWSTSLFIWTFLDPARIEEGFAMLVVLLPLLVALASLGTLLSAGIHLRLQPQKRLNPLTARRQGYVLALFVVSCLLLNAFGALTLLNAGLLALIALLVELLTAIWFAPVQETGEQSGSLRDRRGWNQYGRRTP